MKRILLPTDFSENAYNALLYTTQLFAEEKCTLLIMHSFENQVTNRTSRIDIGKTEAVVDELYSTYEAKCDDLKQKIILDTQNENHSFETIVTSMALSTAINRLIAKEQLDFVVMGSTGKTAAKNILIGSNTLKMLQNTKKAPLLVIPRGSVYSPLKKIVFATGFKREFTKNEMNPLIYLSSLKKASIKVLHVHNQEKMTEKQHANSHQLFELLENRQPENNWVPDDSDNYDAITTFLIKKQIDLLVMVHYKHNFIVRLFRDATIKNIAKYTLIPFLILPSKN